MLYHRDTCILLKILFFSTKYVKRIVISFSINLQSVGVRLIGLYDEVFNGSLPHLITGRTIE